MLPNYMTRQKSRQQNSRMAEKGLIGNLYTATLLSSVETDDAAPHQGLDCIKFNVKKDQFFSFYAVNLNFYSNVLLNRSL